MQKKSVSFRCDERNLNFLRRAKKGGTSMSLIINCAISRMCNDITFTSNCMANFLPETLFEAKQNALKHD